MLHIHKIDDSVRRWSESSPIFAGQADRSSPDLAIHDYMNSHPLQKP